MDVSAPAPSATVVEVVYPPHRGKIGLRGNHDPLSWEHTTQPVSVEGDRHVFRLDLPPHELLEVKLVRNDEEWAQGRNYTLHAGDHLLLEPCFDRAGAELCAPERIDFEGDEIAFQVLLPPSYSEQENKRYPVLYAQDGQSLWTSSNDPFGVWSLDLVLDQLYDLGAIEEVIVVAIDTSERRIERLSHVADPEHGGGEAEKHLRFMTDRLKAHVDHLYRTRTSREDTALLGSSMGGLFSFFAAWSRPDVFGKAACLSSSFWWAERHLVKMVQQGAKEGPKPLLYLDSGAAYSALERDANLRDGFHHTRSMFRALVTHGYKAGHDIHKLTFSGSSHDAASWSARIAIPLQILFPPRVEAPSEAKSKEIAEP